MPSFLQLVTVFDQADFNRTVARKVCKSRRAAETWGYNECEALATKAHEAGEDIIAYEYRVEAVSYLDN